MKKSTPNYQLKVPFDWVTFNTHPFEIRLKDHYAEICEDLGIRPQAYFESEVPFGFGVHLLFNNEHDAMMFKLEHF